MLKDPYETVNLAADPAYADELAALRTRLAERLKTMPDLGFIPERDLVVEAVNAPVVFGEKNRGRISELIDVADLELLPFAEAKDGIRQALASEDAIKRYWGLIVCSTFLTEAKEFVGQAKALAASDNDLLVRARAAEFLGLIKAQDPQGVLLDVLSKSTSEMEATLVLNMITLLQDGEAAYKFEITPEDIHTRGFFADRCLVHLCGLPVP